MQVVMFSVATIKACRQVYQQGSLSEYNNIGNRINHLINVTSSLRQTLQSPSAQSLALTKEDSDLVDLARKCQNCANQLQNELRKLQTQPRASTLDAARRTARAIWKKNTIEGIYKELQAYQLTLEALLLFRLA